MARLPALPFARSGVTQGLSANAAYRNYIGQARENDLTGIRRQDFLRLYGETRALRSTARTAIGLPKDQLPDVKDIVNRGTVNARGYGQWVMVHQRTSGTSDFFSTPFLIKSGQPLTPEEAEQRALGYLDQQPDAYNRVTIGVGYVGTEHFQPKAYH